MKRLDEVLGEMPTVARTEVLAWIEAEWVRPEADATGPAFRPMDVARLHLIRELRQDMEIGSEAIPIVLSLVDEMYTLRRRFAALARALAEAPDEVRTSVRIKCRAFMADEEGEPRP
ncbi:MAG: chaperone modulator CbpM [Geminicoccaceae bacterium]